MQRSTLYFCVVVIAVTPIMSGASASLQSPVPPRPSFDVASVKVNNSGERRVVTVPIQNGRYAATNIPLEFLILLAYQRPEYEIVGIPGWALTARFDVDARSERRPPPSRAEVLQMLQTLLADRFKLVTHNETRRIPVYALVGAKGSEQLGPQLRRHTDDSGCVDRSKYVSAGIPDPAKALPTPACGGWSGAPNLGRLAGQRIDLDMLGKNLSGQLGRPVIERSGLTGFFDLTLEWMPQGQLSPEAQAILDASPDLNRPSIFTALQEQLGLRLVPDTALVDVLVVDSVERPSEN
jgi:uncharacterized protein (TIGR03435 family)